MKDVCKRCGKVHNEPEISLDEIVDMHANELAKDIDSIVLASLMMSDKGYKIGTEEGYREFMKKRNGEV
jgi:hypothetical protein